MTRGVRWYLVSSLVLAALIAVAGCSHYMMAEREPWRAEAELSCLNSGAVQEFGNARAHLGDQRSGRVRHGISVARLEPRRQFRARLRRRVGASAGIRISERRDAADLAGSELRLRPARLRTAKQCALSPRPSTIQSSTLPPPPQNGPPYNPYQQQPAYQQSPYPQTAAPQSYPAIAAILSGVILSGAAAVAFAALFAGISAAAIDCTNRAAAVASAAGRAGRAR